jgi:hypothetical protein
MKEKVSGKVKCSPGVVFNRCRPNQTKDGMKHPSHATRPVRPCRVPDYGPWPPVGFVTPQQVMAALGGCTDETLRNYEKAGLLPLREPFSGARSGWRVDVARRMVEELPTRLAEAARRRQRQKTDVLRLARAARAAQRIAGGA